MAKTLARRPATAWVLIVLQIFLGSGAVISGAMLFSAPDGHLMGWTTGDLAGTPFPNYVIPGVILFLLVGVFQLFAGFGLLTRTRWNAPDAINPLKQYHWSWTASWASGIVLLVWIMVESALLGYISFLQPLIAVWGCLYLVLTLLPATRRYYLKGA